MQVGYVHLIELTARRQGRATQPRTGEHGGARINAGDIRPGRVISAIAPGTDPSVEQPAAKAVEQQGPQSGVALPLERLVEEIVERRDALVACQVLRHQNIFPATTKPLAASRSPPRRVSPSTSL